MRRYPLLAILKNWPGWLEFQMTKFILLRQGITQLRKLCHGGDQNPVQPLPNFGITLHVCNGLIWSAFWIAVLHRVSCVSHIYIYISQVGIPFLSYLGYCSLLQVHVTLSVARLRYRILLWPMSSTLEWDVIRMAMSHHEIY